MCQGIERLRIGSLIEGLPAMSIVITTVLPKPDVILNVIQVRPGFEPSFCSPQRVLYPRIAVLFSYFRDVYRSFHCSLGKLVGIAHIESSQVLRTRGVIRIRRSVLLGTRHPEEKCVTAGGPSHFSR